MSNETPTETCPSCHKGTLVHVDDRPAMIVQSFSCGHKRFAPRLGEDLSSHFTLRFKGKRGGKGRPFVEGKSGDDLHKKDGKWMHREIAIDREKNHYKEKVTNPKTGSVVHACEEPLSQHVDHGSAKKKSKK